MAARNQTTRVITDRWDQVQLREPVGGGRMAGRSVVQKVKNDYLEELSAPSTIPKKLPNLSNLYQGQSLAQRIESLNPPVALL